MSCICVCPVCEKASPLCTQVCATLKHKGRIQNFTRILLQDLPQPANVCQDNRCSNNEVPERSSRNSRKKKEACKTETEQQNQRHVLTIQRTFAAMEMSREKKIKPNCDALSSVSFPTFFSFQPDECSTVRLGFREVAGVEGYTKDRARKG